MEGKVPSSSLYPTYLMVKQGNYVSYLQKNHVVPGRILQIIPSHQGFRFERR